MFVSVTRLRLRSLLFLPSFLILNERCSRQVTASAGFTAGGELVDRGLTFWTVTGWDNEKSMKLYRGSGTHAYAMKTLPRWCSEAAVAHWEQASTDMPDWAEAHRHLVASGRPSPVNRPNANHQARQYRAPVVRSWGGRVLIPKIARES